MSPQQFRGTGVALITPFREGRIDYAALEKIIDYQIAGGIDYLVCLGTSGEAITLSSKECLDVLAFTIKQVDGRIPVVAGYFGSNYTEKLVNSTKKFNFEGVSAIMSSSPAYNKPTQEGIYRHYMELAKVSPLPIIIYNVPSRTASNVLPDTVIRLAEASDKFIAVKEASGDLNQVMYLIKHRPKDFLVLSGDDPLTLPTLACGGDGVISVIGNVFPTEFSDMVQAALDDDWDTARRLHYDLLDVHPWLYVEGNPVGIKAAMEIMGFCTKEVRIPLVSLSDAPYQKLKEAIDKVASIQGV
ncbi:MAG: 4-hydroxy-tetrahydrodipicolinate synthase [Saprospiraceae bacterium]|nr:MAG: 4-hydroxy-tetrahydrodipicolinate synthase [Saprospiraceae bacterium]